MIRKTVLSGIIFLSVCGLFTGCGNEDQLKKENDELKVQVEQLQQENKKLTNDVAMYVPKEKAVSTNVVEADNQPVSLVSVQFPEYVVPQVDVTFKNNTQKVIDGVEFVVICFDNFGRPAKENGKNVSGKITMQKSIQPDSTGGASWNVYSISENTKKGKIIVSQVHFNDGSTWINYDYDKILEKEKGQYE